MMVMAMAAPAWAKLSVKQRIELSQMDAKMMGRSSGNDVYQKELSKCGHTSECAVAASKKMKDASKQFEINSGKVRLTKDMNICMSIDDYSGRAKCTKDAKDRYDETRYKFFVKLNQKNNDELDK